MFQHKLPIYLILLLCLLSTCSTTSFSQKTLPIHPEVDKLLEEGIAAHKAGNNNKALQLWKQGLEKAQALGDKQGTVTLLMIVGAWYVEYHQIQDALPYLIKTRKQARLLDKDEEVEVLHHLADIDHLAKQFPEELECSERLLELARLRTVPADEADNLQRIGAIHLILGDLEAAISNLALAVAAYHRIGDTFREGGAWNDLGIAWKNIGQLQKALDSYQEAIRLKHAAGSNEDEASTLVNMANIYSALGQPQQALARLEQALDIARKAEDKETEAGALNTIGIVHNTTGDPQGAVSYFEQARDLYRKLGDSQGIADSLNNLGIAYIMQKKPQQALPYLEQAKTLYGQANLLPRQAKVLTNLGAAYMHMDQFERALDILKQALKLYRTVNDTENVAGTLTNIGTIYRFTGHPAEAADMYEQALPLHRAVGNKEFEANTLNGLGIAYRDLKQPQKALDTLSKGLMLRESIRENLGTLSDLKINFMESNLAYYQIYILLLLDQKKDAEAFAWTQKTKARALLDLMATGHVDWSAGLSQPDKEKERELQQHISQLNSQLLAAEQQRDATRLQLQQADSALQAFHDSLYNRRPDIANKRMARTAELPDIEKFLPADTALLEYVYLSSGNQKGDKDQIVLFVVTLDQGRAKVKSYPLAGSWAELAAQVTALRQACVSPKSRFLRRGVEMVPAAPQQDMADPARKLYQTLVAPAARQLEGKRRLIFCPDGPLWGLPFQALLIPAAPGGAETFLLERYEIAYAYSATGMQAALSLQNAPDRKPPTANLLAFANPDFGGAGRAIGLKGTPPVAVLTPLPGTQREVEAIRELFPDMVAYTEKQAQEAILNKEAGKYRYLHFATHGILNDTSPLQSCIVLAQPPMGSAEDGLLTARKLLDMQLSAEMVVLSACNTAQGQNQSGEGMVGLTWALSVAGIPTQVVSQWSVADESTASLMQLFYKNLKAENSKGVALQQAALSLLHDGAHAHPFYWAPFILIGNWK